MLKKTKGLKPVRRRNTRADLNGVFNWEKSVICVKKSFKSNKSIYSCCQAKDELPMMPYCGCAGDCLAAGVWRVLLTVALRGLVHVKLMFSDRGLDGAVVLGRGRVRVRMCVRMRMRMGGRELGGNAVLGRGCKLGRWVGLGHGWIRGSRCVLVTLRGEKERDSKSLCLQGD